MVGCDHCLSDISRRSVSPDHKSSRCVVATAAVLALAGCASTPAGGTSASASTAAPDPDLYLPMMTACMERKGYKVTVSQEFGMQIEFAPPDAPQEVIDAALAKGRADDEACTHETGFDKPGAFDREANYRHQLALAECYRSLGYDVHVADRDRYDQGDVNWFGDLTMDELTKAAVCHKK